MLYNRKVDRWILLIVPAALFIYLSARPHLRLRATMPPEFVDLSPSMSIKQRESEQRLAEQYWNCVQTIIQWRFTYGSVLPDSPPEDFRIADNDIAKSEFGKSSRMRYWHRFQKIWVMPSAWTTTHEWSLDWLTNLFRNAVNWLKNSSSNVFSSG